MKNTMIILLMLLLSSWNNVILDLRTITGTVYSGADGSVLPDVTVSVKGTTLNAKTDITGKYDVKVPEKSDVLVFSLKGFVDKEEKWSNNFIK